MIKRISRWLQKPLREKLNVFLYNYRALKLRFILKNSNSQFLAASLPWGKMKVYDDIYQIKKRKIYDDITQSDLVNVLFNILKINISKYDFNKICKKYSIEAYLLFFYTNSRPLIYPNYMTKFRLKVLNENLKKTILADCNIFFDYPTFEFTIKYKSKCS